MKAKINLVRGVVFLLILVLYTGNALATASFETSGQTNGFMLTYDPGNSVRYLAFYQTGSISTASGGGSDPLVATGNRFYWPTAIYTFTAGTSVVDLTKTGTNEFRVAYKLGADPTKDYLTGLSTALSLDVSGWDDSAGTGTGYITWTPVTSLTRKDPSATDLGSPTLNALDFGSTATTSLTSSFTISADLYNFVKNGATSNIGGTFKGALDQVTAAPEPGEWALMLVGMGLIGFTIYRKKYQVALPEWQNVRKS